MTVRATVNGAAADYSLRSSGAAPTAPIAGAVVKAAPATPSRQTVPMATASSGTVLVLGGSPRLVPVDCRTVDDTLLVDVQLRAHPGDWQTATLAGGRTCLNTSGLDLGRYTVQARHGDVVLDAGRLIVGE